MANPTPLDFPPTQVEVGQCKPASQLRLVFTKKPCLNAPVNPGAQTFFFIRNPFPASDQGQNSAVSTLSTSHALRSSTLVLPPTHRQRENPLAPVSSRDITEVGCAFFWKTKSLHAEFCPVDQAHTRSYTSTCRRD